MFVVYAVNSALGGHLQQGLNNGHCRLCRQIQRLYYFTASRPSFYTAMPSMNDIPEVDKTPKDKTDGSSGGSLNRPRPSPPTLPS